MILVTSGKGGSGTTTITTNLGVVLANSGARVLICDMNIGLRNDDIYLGMENRVLFDLGDYISDVCGLEKAIIESDSCSGLYLLPCPQCKSVAGLNSQKLGALFSILKDSFDYILVDCPVTVGRFLEYVAEDADTALLVTTLDFVSVRNTDAVSRRLDETGLEERFLVINMVTEEALKREPSLGSISQIMDIPLAGIISYDEDIHFSNNDGTPIVSLGSTYYVKTFIEIATRIVA